MQDGTPIRTAVGSPFVATDPENNALTYTLSGTDAASFTVEPTRVGNRYAGQLKTAVAINHASKSSYSLTVRVRDSRDQYGNPNTAVDDTQAVTVRVTVPTVELTIADAQLLTDGITEGTNVAFNLSTNPTPLRQLK